MLLQSFLIYQYGTEQPEVRQFHKDYTPDYPPIRNVPQWVFPLPVIQG